MDIGFFFNFEDLVVQLPINPPKISVKYPGNNKTAEVIKLGEINRLRNRKLATLDLSSWFPYEPWFPGIRTTGEFRGPDFYKEFFTSLMDSGKPCRLIVTGVNINMLVSVEDFSYFHQAGDHEDAHYSIALKEFKEFSSPSYDLNVSPSKTKEQAKTIKPEAIRKQTEVTIGTNVLLTGKVHLDSYGSKPGKSFTNYECRVNLINKKGTHIYHVTTLNNAPLGWVLAQAVKIK